MNNRYDKYIAGSEKNVLNNNHIFEGNIIEYFNVPYDVTVESINHRTKQVFFTHSKNTNRFHRWWDYFMDANPMVIKTK